MKGLPMADRGAVIEDLLQSLGAMQDADLENDERERRWSERHPAWTQVVWPNYMGGKYDVFRVYLIGDHDVTIEATPNEGRTKFLRRLEEACIAGTCGIDHSGDPVF